MHLHVVQKISELFMSLSTWFLINMFLILKKDCTTISETIFFWEGEKSAKGDNIR